MLKPIDRKKNDWLGENNIWRELELEKYFKDISDSDELLNNLYVNFTGPEGPINESEPVIHEAYPQVLKTEGIHTAEGKVKISIENLTEEEDWDCAYITEFINEAFTYDEDTNEIDTGVRGTRATKRMLVLIAGIGEGKTTLLDYFSRIWAQKIEELRDIERINIDFEGKKFLEPKEISLNYLAEHIIQEIQKERKFLFEDKDKIYEVLRERLETQEGLLCIIEENQGDDARKEEETEIIKRFYNNPKILAASLINYLYNSEKKRVVVTLDNVDKIRNSESQYKVITLLHESLHQWDCCAIVCVREYTYGNLWLMGDWGFQRPLLYHKRPPRFAPVLSKRFTKFPLEKFAKKTSFYVENKKYEIEKVRRFVINIAKYLWTEDIERCLFRLNNGDIRQMLDMARAFFSYHYLDLQALFLATFLKSRKELGQVQSININFDNFICSVTTGNYRYYCSSEPLARARHATFILNMTSGPQKMPLLPYRILTYLRKFKLVNIKPLTKKAIYLGVSKEQVLSVLESFLNHYLIESMQGSKIENVQEVIITRKGEYYFDELSILATYIENVMNDTWWDKDIDPYEQNFNISQECGFLNECLNYILILELREAKRINRDCWGFYKEFLSKEPYSYRLANNFISYLGGKISKGVKVREKLFKKIETKIHQLEAAIAGEDLPYDIHSWI